MNKTIKIVLVLLLLYYIYKNESSFIKKNKYLFLGGLFLYLIYIFVSDKSSENFALTNDVITDKTKLVAGSYYKVGTIMPEVNSTINPSLNGGTDCPGFPQTIYIPVEPIDAICMTGLSLYNFPNELSLTTCDSLNMKTGALKQLDTSVSVTAAGISQGATKTFAMYGGKTCSQQASLGLLQGYSGPSVKVRCLNALCLSGDNLYNIPPDSRQTCGITNTKTGALKSLDALTTDGGATIIPAIESGFTCARRFGNSPSIKTYTCTSPIPADCIGGVTAIDTNVSTVISNNNYNSNYLIDSTPYSQTYWTTNVPTADDKALALNVLTTALTRYNWMQSLLTIFNTSNLNISNLLATGPAVYTTSTSCPSGQPCPRYVWDSQVTGYITQYNNLVMIGGSTLSYDEDQFEKDRTYLYDLQNRNVLQNAYAVNPTAISLTDYNNLLSFSKGTLGGGTGNLSNSIFLRDSIKSIAKNVYNNLTSITSQYPTPMVYTLERTGSSPLVNPLSWPTISTTTVF